MQQSIWLDYLKKLNKLMCTHHRKILLLVDNAPTHSKQYELPSFSNIKIYYLPPNTTLYLQPLDQEIINSFKVIILNLLLKLYSILIFLLTFFIKLRSSIENC